MGRTVALTASTGIAASLLGTDASTLHHWAGLADGRYSPAQIISRMNERPAVKNKIKNTNTLIIDEVSMMSTKIFTDLAQILQGIGPEGDKPFGGIQVILSGDFLQVIYKCLV